MTNPAPTPFSAPAFAELAEDTQRSALGALAEDLLTPRYDLTFFDRQIRPWGHAQPALLQARNVDDQYADLFRALGDQGGKPAVAGIINAEAAAAAERVALVVVDHNRLTAATRAKAEAMTADGYRGSVRTRHGLVVVGAPKGTDPSAAPRSRLHALGIKRPKQQYMLTAAEHDEIAAATFTVPVTLPEIQLAFYAAELAEQILAIDAWNSDYIANQRLTYDPLRDATEVGRHAINLAMMRTRLIAPPPGDSEQHATARAAIAEQSKILDTLVESLRRRVAAMWAYRGTLYELDERLHTLQALESVIQLTPELEALAAQIDRDMLATDQLARNVSETKALTEQVDHLVHVLQSTLAPLPSPQQQL